MEDIKLKTFTVNEKVYKAKPVDFNMVCYFEDIGISMSEMNKKQMSTVRAYLALCAGVSNVQAGKEMEAHVIAGGNFEEITTVLNEELEQSDFFRALNKTAEEETTKNQKEEK